MVLGESLIQNFLVQSLSVYFDNVDRENVSVAIVRGDVTLSNLHLRKSALNQFGHISKSLRLVHGTVGMLRARVPWHRFGMAPIVFELDNLFVLLEEIPEDENFATDQESSEEMNLLKESANELMKEVEDNASTTTSSSSWGGWFRSAGRLAKRIVDSMEIQIQIKNVHIRFTSDSVGGGGSSSSAVPFSMGLTLDQLAVSTTTQIGSPKIMNMKNFAIYLNPEHEMEDAVEELIVEENSNTAESSQTNGGGYMYVLEPISGTMTFVATDESISVSGEYDHVVIKLTKAQLDTSIYSDLKAILVKTASNPETRGMLSAAATAAYNNITSPSVSDDEDTATSQTPKKILSSNPKTWLTISLALNRAIIRSVSLDNSSGRANSNVDFICDNIYVSGDIAEASAMSQYTFKMAQLNIVTSDMQKVILGANQQKDNNPSPQDFVSIKVKIREDYSLLMGASGPPSPPIDVIFSLGPVYFGFHPKIVSAILNFFKSFPTSSHPTTQNDSPLSNSQSNDRNDSVTTNLTRPKIRIQFMWESMVLDWFALSDSPHDDLLFLKSQMTRSYICLEMYDTFFVSRGELGDFSLTHVPDHRFQERSILALANPETDSYLFKFFVRSWDENMPDFPGHHTEMEFHLSAVRLLVVKSVLMRIWYYVFDAFLPGLTGGLESTSLSPPEPSPSTVPRKYKLFVGLDRLDLLVPLSVTLKETDPARVQLKSLTIRNDDQGAIQFELEQVAMNVLNSNVFENIKVGAELIRDNTIMRIITKIVDLPISINRGQFSYLCDVLYSNLSGNAWDGIQEESGVVTTTAALSAAVADPKEWLRFEFLFGNLDFQIGDLTNTKIQNLFLSISKFDNFDLQINSKCDQMMMAENSRTDCISVSLISSALSRTISVNIQQPVYQVNLALLLQLREYFFDTFDGYTRAENIVEVQSRTNQQSSAGGTPETVFDLTLVGGQIVLLSSFGKFCIHSKMVSLHQNFVSVSETFLRKIVVSNAAIFFSDNNTLSDDDNNRILKNMDLFFSSLATGTNSVTYKVNCEPVQLRIGFSHLKQFIKAVEIQQSAISSLSSTTSTNSASPALTSFRFDRINTEILFHSLRLLIINDFANFQNTPLFSLSLTDLESNSEIIFEDKFISPTSSRINKGGKKLVERNNLNLSFDLEMAVFNKSAVDWEPLIESSGENGSKEIKVSAKRTRIKTYDRSGETQVLVEESNQFVFDINEGTRGVQLNVSESLIALTMENFSNWTKSTMTSHLASSTTAPSGHTFYSPYSVRNMTGEEVINVSWRDDPEKIYSIENCSEIPLSGISVLVENSLLAQDTSNQSKRILANISSPYSGWSVPRLAIDRQGVYIHKISIGGEGAIADLITDVVVTPGDGKKLVSIQSSVLVNNQFGFPLRLKVAGKDLPLPVNDTVPIPLIETVRGGTFKLARDDGEDFIWSGTVSISDIRAKKNDAKLWQISLGNFARMYLSSKARSIVYQDKNCEQIIITVFAPIRIKSSLPVHVNYVITTAGGPPRGSVASSRRSSVSSQPSEIVPTAALMADRGSIGLNGCDYITSIPLTGKVELSLSILDGKASSDAVQIWPVNPEDLIQFKQQSNGSDGKSFFIPLKLYDERRNFLALQLVYDQVEGRPPLITIHSPSWMVCVDCPSQLRFGYQQDLQDEEYEVSDGVVLGSGDKSYSAPLDYRCRKIAAILNSTMSEFVSVDTIGAATTITLDAFDDRIKQKVKQELAVRVSSCDLVKNFPIKITTISPKFVIVNTLKKTIQVRQGAVMNGGGGSHVTVNPGDQVPFKWWITGDSSAVVNRLVTVRTSSPESVWSESINVGEIGERAVQGGLVNSRCEIRLYHGAFYIVFSSTVAEDSSLIDSVSSTAKNSESAAVVIRSSMYRLLLPSLSISLVGPSTTRSIDRTEVAFLQIKTLLVNMSLSPIANEIDVRMENIQLDDYRAEPRYPVVMNRTKRAGGPEGAAPATGAILEFAATWTPPSPGDTVLEFEYISARCSEIDVNIDYSIISDLTEMISYSKVEKIIHKFVPSIEVLPIGSLRIWSVKEFALHQMNVNLSFTPNKSSSSNYSVIHRAISSMAAVDKSPLTFNPLILKNFRASRSNLKSIIAEHYKYQMYREMRTLMGSADAFGNPILLVNSVSTGVSDLFSQPLAAIRDMQRPEDVLNVADKTAQGAKSFFKNTAFGVFNSFSKLAATSAQTLSILTEDEDFMNERSDFHNKNKPNDVADGVAVGAASFGRGIIAGLSGLVTKPVEGLEQEGIAGLAKGTVRGVGGFFLKPIAGLFDFAKSTADGVVVATKDASLETQPLRLPRMLYGHDRVVRIINSEHSLLRWYLLQLEGFPQNFSYCSHVYDSANGVIVAVSSTHVVVADTQLRRISLLVPIWRILGVSADHDRLILSIIISIPESMMDVLASSSSNSRNFQGTSQFDLELSSLFILRTIQQTIASAMEV